MMDGCRARHVMMEQAEPTPPPGLAPLFRDADLLAHVLSLLGLWEVARVGCAVSKGWCGCVRATFGRALASPGRAVRVAGLAAAHPLARLNGRVCCALEPNDDAERAALLESGSVKLSLRGVPRAADSNALAVPACSLPLANMCFETRLCAPLLEAAVRAEVTQQHRGETLTKAGHMKSMAVVALQPCLPFACHRCGSRPETVTPSHPQGKAQPGRQKWWQAVRSSRADPRAPELECMECLILAAVEARLTPDDDLGMFQWQRCVGVMEFFSRFQTTSAELPQQEMDRPGQMTDRQDDESVGDMAIFAAAFAGLEPEPEPEPEQDTTSMLPLAFVAEQAAFTALELERALSLFRGHFEQQLQSFTP